MHLIIYLCFDGGNRSSITTVELWVIKACLFRNQNLLLDRPLHLVAIILFSSPSHMLNSTHVCVFVFVHHVLLHSFIQKNKKQHFKAATLFWLVIFLHIPSVFPRVSSLKWLLTFIWHLQCQFVFTSGSGIFPLAYIAAVHEKQSEQHWCSTSWRPGCPAQQLLPAVTKMEPGRRGKHLVSF